MAGRGGGVSLSLFVSVCVNVVDPRYLRSPVSSVLMKGFAAPRTPDTKKPDLPCLFLALVLSTLPPLPPRRFPGGTERT